MPETDPQRRARRWKRRVILASLLLAGGAVVNVAVAWGITIIANPYDGAYQDEWCLDEPDRVSVVFHYQRRGTELLQLQQWVHDYSWPIPGKANAPFPGALIPRNSWLVRRPFLHDRVSRVIVQQSGFPLRTLECAFLHPSVPVDQETKYQQWQPFETRFGIDLPLNPWPHKGVAVTPRTVPLRPLLPGFIINTLFYALLLWLLFVAPFAARRMIRRRRGLCETCAYPVGTWGGSPVCTECGAAVRRQGECHSS